MKKEYDDMPATISAGRIQKNKYRKLKKEHSKIEYSEDYQKGKRHYRTKRTVEIISAVITMTVIILLILLSLSAWIFGVSNGSISSVLELFKMWAEITNY